MSKKVFTNSVQELNALLEKGYAIVAMSNFLPDWAFTYTLEKGSRWIRMLGSK